MTIFCTSDSSISAGQAGCAWRDTETHICMFGVYRLVFSRTPGRAKQNVRSMISNSILLADGSREWLAGARSSVSRNGRRLHFSVDLCTAVDTTEEGARPLLSGEIIPLKRWRGYNRRQHLPETLSVIFILCTCVSLATGRPLSAAALACIENTSSSTLPSLAFQGQRPLPCGLASPPYSGRQDLGMDVGQ